MLEFLQSPTFRRILAALAGVLLPILNQRFGWNIPTEQVVGSIAGLVALIGSSVLNQAHERGTDAAVAIAQVKATGTVDAAAAAPANVVAVVSPPKP